MYLLFAIFLLSMIIGTGLYLSRPHWIPLLPDRLQDTLYNPTILYSRLPSLPGTSNFMNDVESGFQSSNFDLAGNIGEGDSRSGLDGKAKQEVHRIMKARGIGFDEARALYMQRQFKKGGIGLDGLPNDPKLVTFGGR